MKKVIVLQFLLLFSMGLKACKGEDSGYWVADAITKEDGQAMRGITLAFMEAIAEKKIHLRKEGEFLEFVYPVTKKVAESKLTSITDLKIAKTGQLIDSVYKVVVSGKSLQIKFYYIGTSEEDKRFSLNFTRVEKDAFNREVAILQKERKLLTDKVKTMAVRTLDLSTPLPDYFNEKDLTALSPMQGIDIFLGATSNEIQPTFNSFNLEDSTGIKKKYTKLGIDIPEKAPPAAKFEDVVFNGVEFIRAESKQIQAITLKGDLNKDEILKLYEHIDKSHPEAYVTYTGLPALYMGEIDKIMEWFSITWKDNDNVIKLQVKTPDALFKQQVYKDIYVPEKVTNADIKKVFTDYVRLIDKSYVNVFVLDSDFEAVLWEDTSNGSDADFGDYLR